MYDRIVTAALAETVSKFRLAEALALDIPATTDRSLVPVRVHAAGQAIVAAGGEPRTLDTLSDWRRTAIWAQDQRIGTGERFTWAPGVSFSAHNEARAYGLTYAQFEALPVKTADAARVAAGKAPKSGDTSRIGAWSREQKIRVARDLLAQPGMATDVFADGDAAGDAVRGAYAPLARAMGEHDQRQRDKAAPAGSAEEKTREREQQAYEVLEVCQRLHQLITATGRLAGLGELDTGQREMIAPLARRASAAVDYLAALDDTASTTLSDQTIAEFLGNNS